MATISERLRQALEMRNMRQSELVALTGIGKSSISTYLTGEYEPKQRNIYKIASALDVSEAWLMGLDVPMDRQVTLSPAISNVIPLPTNKTYPLVGNIACGSPILAEENISEYVHYPDDINADFCLRCKGDSMINARIHDGDIVFIRKQEQVENGQIAAVRIGDEATLKRVYYIPGSDRITLRPCNPLYPDMEYEGESLNEIDILGIAVCFLSEIK